MAMFEDRKHRICKQIPCGVLLRELKLSSMVLDLSERKSRVGLNSEKEDHQSLGGIIKRSIVEMLV